MTSGHGDLRVVNLAVPIFQPITPSSLYESLSMDNTPKNDKTNTNRKKDCRTFRLSSCQQNYSHHLTEEISVHHQHPYQGET